MKSNRKGQALTVAIIVVAVLVVAGLAIMRMGGQSGTSSNNAALPAKSKTPSGSGSSGGGGYSGY